MYKCTRVRMATRTRPAISKERGLIAAQRHGGLLAVDPAPPSHAVTLRATTRLAARAAPAAARPRAFAVMTTAVYSILYPAGGCLFWE